VVTYVPTIYVASKTGAVTLYNSESLDIGAMKVWALAAAKRTAPAVSLRQVDKSVSSVAPATDVAPAWACKLPKLADASKLTGHLATTATINFHAVENGQSTIASTQHVQAVDRTSLLSMLDSKTEDILVVFYAPWCPHCKSFVMADGLGNAENAPLEVLAKQIAEAKGPKVVKFDITASLPPPTQFVVTYVPTIYVASKTGAVTLYNSESLDIGAMKVWALAAAKRTAPAV